MRLLAVAVALQLTAGLLAAALVSEPVTATSPVPGRITVDQRLEGAIALDSEPVAAPQRQVLEDERDKEVERLLRTRTAAILGRNREAFLATVDPRAQPLQARQAAMFDALAEVPSGPGTTASTPRATSARTPSSTSATAAGSGGHRRCR